MMHAAALFLASASLVQAQTTFARPLSSVPVSSRSVMAENFEIPTSVEIGQEVVPQSQPHIDSNPIFQSSQSGRPYSQLATSMMCNDWSPKLWDNYLNERAAIVARISQHVDMQYKCFDGGKHCLHSHASSCGVCSSSICGKGCRPKVINRYRAPMSSLYDAPSDSCGPSCASGCKTCASSGVAVSGGCANCGGHSAASKLPSNPAIALRPTIPLMTQPVINTSRVAMPMQQPQFRTEARR